MQFQPYATDKEDQTTRTLDKIGLPKVFQGRSIGNIKSNKSEWRLFIQSTLYQHLINGCGAKYYILFFIRSGNGHGDYWLIHLSQKARARDVMTTIHWEKNTNFIHYGGAGLNMFALGYVPAHDNKFTKQTDLGLVFDRNAKDISINALMEQIPKLIYSSTDGMQFGEIFTMNCNMSPATEKIFREAIGESINYKDLEVIGKDGSKRRSGNAIRDDDRIIAHRHQRFDF